MRDGSSTPTAPDRLRRLVSWQANRVGVLGSRLTLQRMSAGDRADFAVLAALEESAGLSQADIGRRLGLDRNDVNAITTRLEQAGCIARRSDPDDRRRNIVTLLAAGGARLRSIQDRADEVQEELLTALAEDERRQLIELLDKVLAAHGPQVA